jgi:hypothetical protein
LVEPVLSLRIDDLEPRLTRSGYEVRSLAEQFDAKPSEIRRLLRGDLDPARSRELMDEMRDAMRSGWQSGRKLMCAGNGHLLRVGPFIIARRYSCPRIRTDGVFETDGLPRPSP